MILPKRLDTLALKFLESHGYVKLRGNDSLSLQRRKLLLNSSRDKPVDLLLDVGANAGQYGTTMRSIGFQGKILSFEPMSQAYERLLQVAQQDHDWQTVNYGLGDIDEKRMLHISENSVSSSVLDMMSAHLSAAPRSKYVASEEIVVRRLDDVFSELAGHAQSIWLKLDVQGFEDRVLRGAEQSLPKTDFIQIELSLKSLYAQQTTYLQMCAYLEQRGFNLIGLEPGFTDPSTGRLLQADGIFRRHDR